MFAQGAAQRQRLEDFVKDPAKVAALKRGVAAMKARNPSDPTSWFFQAAVHAVRPKAVSAAQAKDANVASATQFWNKCPHHGEASAEFLLWHRGYLYYFERILRAASGDPTLSLPYWNYNDPAQRTFPALFGDPERDASGRSRNPLYDERREQAFMDGLYLLSPEVADGQVALAETRFFGPTDTEGFAGGVADANVRTRGLIEQAPHDLIHFAIGGAIGFGDPEEPGAGTTAGLMASVPTAAFDPVFWVHHANIDRMWTVWDCLPNRKWGGLPPEDWFTASPWTFFDEAKSPRSHPRAWYLKRANLGTTYDSDNAACRPFTSGDLPKSATASQFALMLAGSVNERSVSAQAVDHVMQGDTPLKASLVIPASTQNKRLFAAVLPTRRVFLELRGLALSGVTASGFDVFVNPASDHPNRSDPGFVGTVALFGLSHGESTGGHANHAGNVEAMQRFDVTQAVTKRGAGAVTVLVQPFDLLTPIANTPRLRRPGALTIRELALVDVGRVPLGS